MANAQGIVLCHNHPSGELRPSPQDDSITNKIVAAAKYLDIEVVDHVIVTNDSFYSYSDEGRI